MTLSTFNLYISGINIDIKKMIFPIALFSATGLIFIVLSILIGKKTEKINADPNRVLVGLLRLFGIAILVVGNSYAVLDHKGWTTENAAMFKLIVLATICLVMVLVGIRFVTINRSGMARTGALVWIVLWLAMGGFGYKLIAETNKGWTEESKQRAINKCPSIKYERLCYLEQVLKKFDTPEDYNSMSTKEQEDLNKALDKHCKLCDEEREAKETETVEGLPDDF